MEDFRATSGDQVFGLALELFEAETLAAGFVPLVTAGDATFSFVSLVTAGDATFSFVSLVDGEALPLCLKI